MIMYKRLNLTCLYDYVLAFEFDMFLGLFISGWIMPVSMIMCKLLSLTCFYDYV